MVSSNEQRDLDDLYALYKQCLQEHMVVVFRKMIPKHERAQYNHMQLTNVILKYLSDSKNLQNLFDGIQMALTIQTALSEGMKPFVIQEALNFDYFAKFIQQMGVVVSGNVATVLEAEDVDVDYETDEQFTSDDEY